MQDAFYFTFLFSDNRKGRWGIVFFEIILQLIHKIASAPITSIYNHICINLAFYENHKDFCLITLWSQNIPLGRLQNTFI